jgi:hypothetical protein
VSIAVSKSVWDNGPETPTDTLMLLALAEHSDHTGYCWPGIETLARMCRVSRRSAQKTLRKLESEGWIRVVVKGGGRLSNRYQIDLGRLAEGCHPRHLWGVTHDTLTVIEPSRESLTHL